MSTFAHLTHQAAPGRAPAGWKSLQSLVCSPKRYFPVVSALHSTSVGSLHAVQCKQAAPIAFPVFLAEAGDVGLVNVGFGAFRCGFAADSIVRAFGILALVTFDTFELRAEVRTEPRSRNGGWVGDRPAPVGALRRTIQSKDPASPMLLSGDLRGAAVLQLSSAAAKSPRLFNPERGGAYAAGPLGALDRAHQWVSVASSILGAEWNQNGPEEGVPCTGTSCCQANPGCQHRQTPLAAPSGVQFGGRPLGDRTRI
ncbi:hypothetical protein B0T17DRAFT_502160 [Bombardia bombarda]|uniref:Uncharacterized protein n=1 Tax=Bombardia bombarda TaxID=252184 RepID=A0AA39XI99_9PEZI|nr:hypothetical protein B0T17DRAFT_502160 [Bombardia bombarda]